MLKKIILGLLLSSQCLAVGFMGAPFLPANNKLSVFAATTSAELAGVISNETGSGALVFANTPTLISPIIGAATGTSVALTALSSINANSASLRTPPTGTLLHLSNTDSTTTAITIDGFGTGPIYYARRAQGTQASPSAVGVGNNIVNLSGIGYGSTGYSSARGAIILSPTETWTDSAQGTKWTLSTTASGTTTTSTKLTVDDNITASVNIINSAGTGAMPTYNASGTAQNVTHAVVGSCTLSSGTCTITLSGAAAYTSTGSYYCSCNDTGGSAIACSTQNQSASSFVIFGTLTDNVTFSCIGN